MKTNDVIDHFRVEPGYWFVPKLFGIGATPVTWQGWALTIGFSLLLVLDVRFMPETIAKVGVAVALALVFFTVVVRKTQGGWGWRWGVRK